ncbi:hypothetical protein JTB14_027481 [Gonioctena quinquepunctata]|nr:hypothetical protein JTB14_027481 [Gonioctena quinquepunctata]
MSESLHVEEFKNVNQTVRFIKFVDQLFDILNSRNIYARGMKIPMKQETSDERKPFIEGDINYLQNCKIKGGIPSYRTRKRTPILGFIISAKSMINIYETEIVQNENLKYLVTYQEMAG